MNQERVEKLLDNSLVKIRYLKSDLEKVLQEIKTQRGEDKHGKNQ